MSIARSTHDVTIKDRVGRPGYKAVEEPHILCSSINRPRSCALVRRVDTILQELRVNHVRHSGPEIDVAVRSAADDGYAVCRRAAVHPIDAKHSNARNWHAAGNAFDRACEHGRRGLDRHGRRRAAPAAACLGV